MSVDKRPQTLRFDQLPDRKLDDLMFNLTAEASSGLPVSFSVVSGPATIRGSMVVLEGEGVVEIKATQAGDFNTQPVEAVQSFRVFKRSQNIIGFDKPKDRKRRDRAFSIQAESTSGLTVVFRIVSGPAKVSGNEVTLTGAGLVKIAATQEGDATFDPAPEVVRTFKVKDPRLVFILIGGILLLGIGGFAAYWGYRKPSPKPGQAIVQAPVNQPPGVSVAVDRSAISLGEWATLSGTVTDDGLGKPDGKVTVEWSKVSGPGKASFANAKGANTTVRFDKAGTYELQLTATDGKLTGRATSRVTVSVANRAPEVSATVDRPAVILGERAMLTGVVNDDGLPKPPGKVTVGWSQVSGPGKVIFATATAASSEVSFDRVGVYELRLTASDGQLTNSVGARVTVSMANRAPEVSVTVDRPAINLAERATLTGTVMDDGLPKPPGKLTVGWSQVSGPGKAIFATATAASTAVSFDRAGVYELRLTASDGQLTNSVGARVTVSMANRAPEVSVTVDRPAINLAERATLTGRVVDDGLPKLPGKVTVGWSQLSGPGKASFATATALNTTVSFDQAGTYDLLLTANDGELTGRATNRVTVSMTNQAPGVIATVDRSVINLGDKANLTGTVTDDGLPKSPGKVAVGWSQVSGPGKAIFATVTAPNTVVSFDQAGVYDLRLTASDGLLTNSAVARVTVSMTNRPPQVSAKVDRQAITLAERATLTSTVTDDGLPKPPGKVTVGWSQVSGPGKASFATANALITTVSFDQAGDYVLQLVASDGELLGTNKVTVKVGQANVAPVVTIAPVGPVEVGRSVDLQGSVRDDGLPKVPGKLSFIWTNVSGPGTATFTEPTAANTTASFNQAGTFELQLTANDGELTGRATCRVTVSLGNQLPVAPPPSNDIAKLKEELEAFRIWFGLAKTEAGDKIANPPGYADAKTLGVAMPPGEKPRPITQANLDSIRELRAYRDAWSGKAEQLRSKFQKQQVPKSEYENRIDELKKAIKPLGPRIGG